MTAVAPRRVALTLSDVQADFANDQHRYCGFVGGIGSGKSYAGAAKALMHHLGRPGLGLVYAPTYPMLRDATWRTALEVWAPLLAEVARHEMRLVLTTGAEVLFRSADDPERLRGPNADWAWIDEGSLCHPETFPVAIGRLRAGGTAGPCWVTFTPKGALNWTYRVFVTDANQDTNLHRATTLSNPFIATEYVDGLTRQYTNRTARQELGGEFLTDTPGALWNRVMLDDSRVTEHPDLARIVVAIDPAGSEDGDETGIIVAGKGVDGDAYILADLSCQLSPNGWAKRAINAYHAYKADRIIAETNYGGLMVGNTIKTIDRSVAYTAITASRGKVVRAEPVASLYEDGRVHHVGNFPTLEDQMTSFVAGTFDDSPDRVDALVWALTDLMVQAPGTWRAV